MASPAYSPWAPLQRQEEKDQGFGPFCLHLFTQYSHTAVCSPTWDPKSLPDTMESHSWWSLHKSTGLEPYPVCTVKLPPTLTQRGAFQPLFRTMNLKKSFLLWKISKLCKNREKNIRNCHIPVTQL